MKQVIFHLAWSSEKKLPKVLEDNDLEIIWTSVGEKLIIGRNDNRNEWLGRLNISDFVFFENKGLKSIGFREHGN